MTNPSHGSVNAEPEKASIAHFFDDMAVERNALFRSNPVLDYEQQVRSRAVLARLVAQPGELILDIGCGNARDIIPILEAGATVVGVDLSAGMIEQARQDLAIAGYRDVRLEVGDATQLAFASGTFDKVLCSEVIEHIPDASQAIREMARVLKPGGVLVISTPNRRSWYGFDRYGVWTGLLRRRWNHPFDNWRTMRELRSLLEHDGFTLSSTTTTCYLPGFLATYFLPRPLQSAVVIAATALAPLVSKLAPANGYLLVATAIKR